MTSKTFRLTGLAIATALTGALAACGGGGGGGSVGTPAPVPAQPFESPTTTPPDGLRSVALTALVQTLYSATGYLVDDSIAYRAAYSSVLPPADDGKVTTSKISCTAGSAAVVSGTDSSLYFDDNSVLYELDIDTAGCQLPKPSAVSSALVLTESGGVTVSETYDSTGLPLNYDYQFGGTSSDTSATATHALTASLGSLSLTTSSSDTRITGTRSGTGSKASISEQISGIVDELVSGAAAGVHLDTTFTRRVAVESGQPTLISGPADPAQHFALFSDTTWGNESCLTALSDTVLDIDAAAPIQYSASSEPATVGGGSVTGQLVTALDAQYTVAISISAQGVATVKLTDASATDSIFTFDANTLIKSASICGGGTAFWQQLARRSTLAKRIQGS